MEVVTQSLSIPKLNASVRFAPLIRLGIFLFFSFCSPSWWLLSKGIHYFFPSIASNTNWLSWPLVMLAATQTMPKPLFNLLFTPWLVITILLSLLWLRLAFLCNRLFSIWESHAFVQDDF